MTGQELRAIRKRLDLSQARLARCVDVATESVSRWERGEIGISGTAAVLMKLLDRHPELVDELEPKRTTKK